jgi:hypothetical protein
MPPEQNQQGRRPHYHRGRRGSDRRGGDRRNIPPPQSEQGGRDGQDVEQIMREIRARISQRHGIELTSQQVQELAARRLEAILDPRTVNPSLLEQLRRSAGKVPETAADTTPPYVFEDRTIYESHNGLLRFIRRLLNPILKLFFNPNPIAHALNVQAKLNAESSAREAERDRRQAEWNALHYDLLQRLVTETARGSIEMQSLATRVESLGARVDFADRRVRAMEAGPQTARPPARQPESRPVPALPSSAAVVAAPEEVVAAEPRAPESAPGEGTRRRRRRRRGRRSGVAAGEATGAVTEGQLPESDMEGGEGSELEEGDDELAGTADAGPAGIGADAGRLPAVTDVRTNPAAGRPAPPMPPAPPSEASVPEPAAEAPSTSQPTAAAAPPPFPQDEDGSATTPPSLPRDEPAPALPDPPPEPGPQDR